MSDYERDQYYHKLAAPKHEAQQQELDKRILNEPVKTNAVDAILGYVWIQNVNGKPTLLHNPEKIQAIIDREYETLKAAHELSCKLYQATWPKVNELTSRLRCVLELLRDLDWTKPDRFKEFQTKRDNAIKSITKPI